MLWIPITLAAAFLQNARSALQKRLSADLSTQGAAFSRFGFAAPAAILYAVLVLGAGGTSFAMPPAAFWPYAAVGGFLQISATVLLLASFRHGSFAVGTAFSKTESLQAAAFGLVVLGESVGLVGTLGLIVGFFGVLILARGGSASGWGSPKGLALGTLSGTAFAIAAVCYRAAALSLPYGTVFERAAVLLAVVTTMQTVGMGIWLAWRQPGEVTRVVRAWRLTAPTALIGVAASACWFTAMTLQQVAYVRALGQVELVFSTLVSILFFKEKITGREMTGILLVGVSIVAVLIAAAR